MKRFDDSVDVDYKRFSNAAIVVEKDSLKQHVENITADYVDLAKLNCINLFAVPIESIKAVYERMYKEVVNV